MGAETDELSGLRDSLRRRADPERARTMQRYFKTGPGEYGEGDVFIGVSMPDARRVAREFSGLGLGAALELLGAGVHEERMVALLILVRRYEREPELREPILAAYLENTAHVDNWDLVDLSAPVIVGAHVAEQGPGLLDRLAGSELLWERRIAVLATLPLIRGGDYGPTLRLAERLLDDPEDLIRKACGWMLREVGKRDEALMVRFIEDHGPQMPRTMLRYAIERLPAEERGRLMGVR